MILKVFDALQGIAVKLDQLVKRLLGKVDETVDGAPDTETIIVRSSRKPRGRRTPIPDNLDDAIRRSLIRENESADILADAGFDVEQNPIVGGVKNPDYRIDGIIYDNYAPSTNNVRNIWRTVEGKVSAGQANNIVLNLSDSGVDIVDLTKQFSDWPIEGLGDIKLINSNGYQGSL